MLDILAGTPVIVQFFFLNNTCVRIHQLECSLRTKLKSVGVQIHPALWGELVQCSTISK